MNHNMLRTKQHLVIHLKRNEDDYYPYANAMKDYMWNQLALLGMKMLERPHWGAEMESCTLKVGEQEWSYSGNEVNHDLHILIEALQERVMIPEDENEYSMSLTMEYFGEIAEWEMTEAVKNTDYSRGINLTTMNLGPEGTLKFLDSLSEEQLEGIFYSCWQNDWYPDLETPDCGTLHAYGVKDGKYYHGEVPFRAISVAETSGHWECDYPDFDLDATVDPEGENAAEIDRLADKVMEWSDEQGACYVQLNTSEEVEAYLKDVGDLYRLIPYFYHGAYLDKSGDDVRLLHVYLHEDGSFNLELAET